MSQYTTTEARDSGSVGRHPWENDQGNICPRVAGTWIANMILTAGGSASTAFACAQLLSEEIEKHSAKFGTNPALDRHPINPNHPGPIRNGAPFDCPKCGKRHQVGFCRQGKP